MSGTYSVNVGSFAGPFELLLHLVARSKMDIYDIPLAQITDEYLSVVRRMEQLDLDVATDFLVVAATLIELKAARLLPGDDDGELDELALEARDLLYARLLDYRTFKQAAAFLGQRLELLTGYVPRAVPLEPRYAGLVPPPQLTVSTADLAALAARALATQADVDVTHLQPVLLTVRDAAALVGARLQRAGGSASFADVTAGCRHRGEVVVCFLALLELYKLELVDLEQAANFGDLTVVAAASLPDSPRLALLDSLPDVPDEAPGTAASAAPATLPQVAR